MRIIGNIFEKNDGQKSMIGQALYTHKISSSHISLPLWCIDVYLCIVLIWNPAWPGRCGSCQLVFLNTPLCIITQ